MANSIRFTRSCPSCCQPLQISIELLGKNVVCKACGAGFQACSDATIPKPVDDFDLRVARLIQAADMQLEHYDAVKLTQSS